MHIKTLVRRRRHPSTKDDDHEASIGELVGLTKPQKVVAIGECGLDYYYEEAPYDAQLERFARHIELQNWQICR